MNFPRIFLICLLITSFASIPAEARITGAFFQLNEARINQTRLHWQEHLDLMQKAGMDTIIIQYSATDSKQFFGSGTGNTYTYSFFGPFAAGNYEIVIERGPLVLYEIETSSPFNYEISGSLPSTMFGDDGEKLKDKNRDSLDSAVVWGIDAKDPIIISIELEEATDSISIIARALSENNPLPDASEFTLNGKTALGTIEDDYFYILDEAEKRDMKVWLGLKLSDMWWSGNLDLKKDLQENLALAKDLCEKYGAFQSFYGFYIPHELYPSGMLPQNYLDFFSDLTKGLHKLGKPVSIAPYFGGNMSPKAHGRYWDRFLSEVPLDVLMLQDGVGCHRLPVEEIPRYYKEVYEICQKHDVEFWSDLEVFHQLSGSTFSAEPASFDRVQKQIVTQRPVVDKIVIFDWLHYMAPNNGPQAKKLYEDYLNWFFEQQK
ncbi:MAG TPA: DUF4434 domain-containing protein [Firmicutes bacterium]|jgi:hypothetical protein|nr:DUF4434 domain-containing protein [Bacillota bacterium]